MHNLPTTSDFRDFHHFLLGKAHCTPPPELQTRRSYQHSVPVLNFPFPVCCASNPSSQEAANFLATSRHARVKCLISKVSPLCTSLHFTRHVPALSRLSQSATHRHTQPSQSPYRAFATLIPPRFCRSDAVWGRSPFPRSNTSFLALPEQA